MLAAAAGTDTRICYQGTFERADTSPVFSVAMNQ